MIEVGARYTYQHCMNIDSEWNGKVVTVVRQYNSLPLLWWVVQDDGTRGAAFEDELTLIEE